MLILIIIIIFLLFLLNNNLKKKDKESFINFRLPNDGHWCKNNNCDYPVISIINPNLENKKLIQNLEKKTKILPKDKNLNATCLNCIMQDNGNCIYVTIDSKDSILKISELFIDWFNLMDIKEKFYLFDKKSFIFKDNNLFFKKKEKDEKKNKIIKELIIKPNVIIDNENSVYGDELIVINNQINVSIEFFILLLVIYYKLNFLKKSDKDLKYNDKDKKFIKNYINVITKNFKFNSIKDNKYLFNKKDEYYEKCNFKNLDNSLDENIYHEINKKLINETSKVLHNNLSAASLKIDSIYEKNKYLSDILDKKNFKNNNKNIRKDLLKKNNVFNEKCLNDSKSLYHYNNYYSNIDNENYIYSCGNYFTNNQINQNKLISCDGHGKNYFKNDEACLIPDSESFIKKIDNRFPLFNKIQECTVTSERDSIFCNKKYFSFIEDKYLEFDEEEIC